MDSLATLWKSRTLSNESKAGLIQSLVWPIVTYGAEAWTLNKEVTGNIEAFEMQCYRRALRIPYTEHVSNAEVLDRMGQQRKPLGRIRERKLKYFGHVMRHNSLEEDVMLGPMPGLRRQGGQRRQWLDDLCDCTDLSVSQMVRAAEVRISYRKLVHTASYARLAGTVHYYIRLLRIFYKVAHKHGITAI